MFGVVRTGPCRAAPPGHVVDVWGDVLPRSYTFMEPGVGAGGAFPGPLKYPEIVANDVETAVSVFRLVFVRRTRRNYVQGDAGRPSRRPRNQQQQTDDNITTTNSRKK